MKQLLSFEFDVFESLYVYQYTSYSNTLTPVEAFDKESFHESLSVLLKNITSTTFTSN